MRLKLIPLLFISLLFLSAKDGCNSSKLSNPVEGEWVWVKTFCCGRNSVWSSPETCKTSQSLTLNKNGTFELNRVGQNIEKGKYILRRGLNDFQMQQGDSSLVIQFNDDIPAYVQFLGDTMVLSRGYMDYDNVYYVRKMVKTKNK
jgi:hypothetical protein